MDDDLNTPRALALAHDALRDGNQAYAEGDDAALAEALARLRAMLDVLGLDPLDPAWAGGDDSHLRTVIGALVSLALEQREAARARKDWAAADAVRDQLKRAGVVVEDTPPGPAGRSASRDGHGSVAPGKESGQGQRAHPAGLRAPLAQGVRGQ